MTDTMGSGKGRNGRVGIVLSQSGNGRSNLLHRGIPVMTSLRANEVEETFSMMLILLFVKEVDFLVATTHLGGPNMLKERGKVLILFAPSPLV